LVANLRALGSAANNDGSVDRVTEGDGTQEVRGIAVAWMPYLSVIEDAIRLGCNVVVAHEPAFYDHFDRDVDLDRLPATQAKRLLIANNGIAIVRCHDAWDTFPGVGVLDSWARLLDLGPELGRSEFGRVMDVSGRTARLLARRVANRTKALGQPAVQLIGDADTPVSRVAIGTGAITPYFAFLREFGADCAICTDDGIEYWREGLYAIDNHVPIIVVNHGVAEEAGMIGLAQHLKLAVPQVPVHHFAQGCMYKLVVD
jgi:putative NIF3 family GTP cyclohydrolase 1 type 2